MTFLFIHCPNCHACTVHNVTIEMVSGKKDEVFSEMMKEPLRIGQYCDFCQASFLEKEKFTKLYEEQTKCL